MRLSPGYGPNNHCWATVAILLALAAWGQDKPANSDIENIGRRDVSQVATTYSLDKEIALGRQVSAEYEKQVRLSNDPELGEYINHLGQNIVLNSDVRKLPITFKVVESDEPGGMTFPGGTQVQADSHYGHAFSHGFPVRIESGTVVYENRTSSGNTIFFDEDVVLQHCDDGALGFGDVRFHGLRGQNSAWIERFGGCTYFNSGDKLRPTATQTALRRLHVLLRKTGHLPPHRSAENFLNFRNRAFDFDRLCQPNGLSCCLLIRVACYPKIEPQV